MARASRTLVVKIGSSTLIDKKGRLDRQYLHNLARQLEELREMGWAPIVVSSGAIAVGLNELGIKERPHDVPSLQAAASVGQGVLSTAYAEIFEEYGMLTSVVLLTRHDTASRHA